MLRPTFLAFETAKRALSASQRGLDTVGHNIANVNTPGYTRQRVDQVSISSGGYKQKYQLYGSQASGQGSDVIGISQIRDPFLDKRYRTEAATAGEQSAVSDGLAHINAIFDEILKTGSAAKLGEFITALDKLSGEYDNKEFATVLRNKAEQFTNVLNKNYKDLENTTTQINSELGYTIDDVNSILEKIAHLNVKIKEDNMYGNPSLELQDDRNLLIDQLSELVDIEVKNTPVKISSDVTISQLSIELKGSGDPANGIDPIKLVDSGNYNGLKLHTNNDGTVNISLIDGLSGFEIKDPITGSSDITKKLFTGAIKGHLDILNGQGSAAPSGENGFRGIPYYKAQLDGYAREFAQVMNEMNAVQVWDNELNPPGFSTIERPLFATDTGDSDIANITAKNITVSQQWKDNPQYITAAKKNNALYTDAGTKTLQIRVDENTLQDTTVKPSDIGGIDAHGYLLDHNGDPILYNGTDKLNISQLKRAITEGDNAYTIGDQAPDGYLPGNTEGDNLLSMKLALQGTRRFGQMTGGTLPYTGSFEEFLVSFQGEMALDKELNDSLLDASLGVLGGLADSRDAISAVSVDEEGINMMTYQNYYNAAARYMTVLDEALGTIIQGMGVVGR